MHSRGGGGAASPPRPHRRQPSITATLALLLAAAAAPVVSEEPKCVAIDYTVSSGLCRGLRLRGNRCLVEFLGLSSQLFGDRVVGLAEDNASLDACREYAQTICLAAPVKADYCVESLTAGVCERMRRAFFGSVGCDFDSDCTLALREYAPVGDGYNGFTPDKPCCAELFERSAGLWCDASETQAQQTKEVLKDIGRCYDQEDRPVACAALAMSSSHRASMLTCALCSLLASFLARRWEEAVR